MTQHASLTSERWGRFTLDQQVLMIGNEMNRASKFGDPADRALRRNAYERVLALTDLTIAAHSALGLRRELLRWRDLVAAIYADVPPDGGPDRGFAIRHAEAFRALLRFTPEASRQIPHVLGQAADTRRP